MAGAYRTEGRILEQLALNEELSVSQLARMTGLSYPTVFYKASSFPFLSFQKAGKEKRVRIRDEEIDAVYPFLIALQTNRTKKAELALAFLSRKGLNDALLGGEPAFEAQLPVKDADPDPEIEIRIKNRRAFGEFVSRMLNKTIESELTSNIKIVEDSNISPSKKIGLLHFSRPEKLLVDAVAEKQSKVFIENVAETMANSPQGIDMDLLKSYARKLGVLNEVLRVLEVAQEQGFP